MWSPISRHNLHNSGFADIHPLRVTRLESGLDPAVARVSVAISLRSGEARIQRASRSGPPGVFSDADTVPSPYVMITPTDKRHQLRARRRSKAPAGK